MASSLSSNLFYYHPNCCQFYDHENIDSGDDNENGDDSDDENVLSNSTGDENVETEMMRMLTTMIMMRIVNTVNTRCVFLLKIGRQQLQIALLDMDMST